MASWCQLKWLFSACCYSDADFDQTKKVRKLQKLLNQVSSFEGLLQTTIAISISYEQIAVLQEKQERGQELDQDQVGRCGSYESYLAIFAFIYR